MQHAAPSASVVNVDSAAQEEGRSVSRRELLSLSAAGGVAAAAFVAGAVTPALAAEDDPKWRIQNDRIKQSVVHWCFEPMTVEELAQAAAAMGLKSVRDRGPQGLAHSEEARTRLRDYSQPYLCARLEPHRVSSRVYRKLTEAIEATGAAGFPNVITFSGMREGISDEEGIKNTVDGLKKVLSLAEKNKVTLCIEPLNTRVNVEMKGHPGYQCDRVEWAVEVCDRIGSPNVKILFDIYHTQIMQGDVTHAHPPVQGLYRPLPHGRCAWAERSRRPARGQLPGGDAGDCRYRLSRLCRAGVHPAGRGQDRRSAPRRADVRRVSHRLIFGGQQGSQCVVRLRRVE